MFSSLGLVGIAVAQARARAESGFEAQVRYGYGLGNLAGAGSQTAGKTKEIFKSFRDKLQTETDKWLYKPEESEESATLFRTELQMETDQWLN